MNNLMCNTDKLSTVMDELTLNHYQGDSKEEILNEHITYAHSRVFFVSTLFSVYLMHGQIPYQCTKTVFEPICKNKNGSS